MDMMHNARADIMFLNARVVCITHTAPHKAVGLESDLIHYLNWQLLTA